MRTETSALTAAFAAATDRALVMPFLVAGYPTADATVEIARAAADNGGDIFEIGIPFSDPIMDGPVIQGATVEVLGHGQGVSDALGIVERIASSTAKPVVAMTYYNLIFHRGVEPFARALASAGAAGAIVPDLSVEDSDAWCTAARAAGLDTVFLAAQTSPDDRLDKIAGASSGFVYAASLLGVTGVRESLNDAARALVGRIKRRTQTPVAVGIGVSTPQHAREVSRFADGVIVGSAIVKRVADARDPAREVGSFVAELREACAR
ncbi:MAG: tryptophan synthase subunit alpha [Actinomycetota bacterium]